MCDLCDATYIVDENTVDAIIKQCLSSAHVQGNTAYAKIAKTIIPTGRLQYYPDDLDVVNAYAWKIPEQAKEEIKKLISNSDEYSYAITVTPGYMRWVTVLASITATLAATKSIRKARKQLEWCANRVTHGQAGSDFEERFVSDFKLKEDPLHVDLSRAYASGILSEFVGHELGHICLGHTDRTVEMSNSMSRNAERQADLFATSIMQSYNCDEVGAVGAAMNLISFTWLSKNRESDVYKYNTHPVDSERISNMLNAFDAQLKYAKINRKMLMALARL